jgi:hypothetical protein
MSNITLMYHRLCETPSDIHQHLPTLMKYASECEHITEMGVRNIVSTFALLMGEPKRMISYDINWASGIESVIQWANAEGIDFDFRLADTTQLTIAETDLLFIDTLHNYNQLKKELELHSHKVRKYLIFHDTTSFEFIGESYEGKVDEKGIWYAIEELLEEGKWELKERFTNNNGLTILKRK